MDFSSRTSRKSKQSKKERDVTAHPLQFYRIPPAETISLQKFEEFAIERLKVLKAVENAGVKFIKGTNNYKEHLEKEIRKTNFKGILRTDQSHDKDLQRMDLISHFILRLAYCRSEELRRWFLAQELDLFRYRFQLLTIEDRKSFLVENNLNYQPIQAEEKTSIYKELIDAAGPRSNINVDVQEFFKVPFIEVLDLVRSRRVYLEKGYAFVPRDDMISILLTHYRAHLSHSLAVTCRALPHLEEDDRLLPMLCGLSKRYIGEDYGSKKSNVGEVTADMIEMLSRQSFPLCMQQLHQSFRQNHHLRHGGRQQYGLFLKGIGLSLEEAMRFWKNEFMKAIDGDKFDKQYSYNIRHNYGKEGKRADYTPYSCVKIIMSNAPGPGDFHGCPFKHTDPDLLAQKLRSLSLSKDSVESIVKYAREGHYQVACQNYFTATHPNFEEDININHPNGYFEESRRFLNQGSSGNKSQLGTPRTQRTSSQVKNEGTPSSQLISQTPSTQTSTLGDFDDMGDEEFMDIAMETDSVSIKKESS